MLSTLKCTNNDFDKLLLERRLNMLSACINSTRPRVATWGHRIGSALVQVSTIHGNGLLPDDTKPYTKANETKAAAIKTTFPNFPSQHDSPCQEDVSPTLSCDFRHLTLISDDLRVIPDVFVKLSQEKNVEEIE